MSVLLLRHAKAGDREAWTGDDRVRPVTDRGRQQADALVTQYAGRPVQSILTSPYVRCVQTVEPLATARGLTVQEVDELAEGTPLDAVHRLVGSLTGTDAVLCTHGDVLAAVIIDLAHRGVDVGERPAWQKASTWVLDGDLGHPTATYLPPPA